MQEILDIISELKAELYSRIEKLSSQVDNIEANVNSLIDLQKNYHNNALELQAELSRQLKIHDMATRAITVGNIVAKTSANSSTSNIKTNGEIKKEVEIKVSETAESETTSSTPINVESKTEPEFEVEDKIKEFLIRKMKNGEPIIIIKSSNESLNVKQSFARFLKKTDVNSPDQSIIDEYMRIKVLASTGVVSNETKFLDILTTKANAENL